MRTISYLLSFIFLFLLFLFAANSIVSAKKIELKLKIQKDRIMNYELSSKTLKSKMNQVFMDRDNFSEELRINTIESSLLNVGIQEWSPRIGFFQRSGFLFINIVRWMNFRYPISLYEDQKTLLLIQYAFYQERRRKYSSALEYYERLDADINPLIEESAFINLHQGFNLAMLGKKPSALIKLDKVIHLFPNSHYSENAIVLKNLIMDSLEKESFIKNKYLNERKLANELYMNGNYEETIRILKSKKSLDRDDSYILARSMEETGRTDNAILNYLELIEQKDRKDIAKKANRRLMLLGNFYHKNKDLADISTAKAIQLDDRDSMKLIEIAKSNMEETKIVSAIQDSNLEWDSEEKQLLEDLKRLDSTDENESISNDLSERLKEKKISMHKSIEANTSSRNPFQVRLKDGRILTVKRIEFQKDSARLITDQFPIQTPLSNIESCFIEFGGYGMKESLKIHTKSKDIQAHRVVWKGEEVILHLKAGKEKLNINDLSTISRFQSSRVNSN